MYSSSQRLPHHFHVYTQSSKWESLRCCTISSIIQRTARNHHYLPPLQKTGSIILYYKELLTGWMSLYFSLPFFPKQLLLAHLDNNNSINFFWFISSPRIVFFLIFLQRKMKKFSILFLSPQFQVSMLNFVSLFVLFKLCPSKYKRMATCRESSPQIFKGKNWFSLLFLRRFIE
jgi:hypothetical protein